MTGRSGNITAPTSNRDAWYQRVYGDFVERALQSSYADQDEDQLRYVRALVERKADEEFRLGAGHDYWRQRAEEEDARADRLAADSLARRQLDEIVEIFKRQRIEPWRALGVCTAILFIWLASKHNVAGRDIVIAGSAVTLSWLIGPLVLNGLIATLMTIRMVGQGSVEAFVWLRAKQDGRRFRRNADQAAVEGLNRQRFVERYVDLLHEEYRFHRALALAAQRRRDSVQVH